MRLSAPVAFPLLPIVDGACGCGRVECKQAGKHPAVAWRAITATNKAPPPVAGAGYGLRTGAAPEGSGTVVVDLDGAFAMAKWQELGGHTEPTLMVDTPRGIHLYFQHPGFHVGNSASALAKGIDIRGDGGYVVGPGSPHVSGHTYELVEDVEPAPLPAWLLEWLRARPAPAEIAPAVGDVTDPEERAHRRSLFADYCAERPAAGKGSRDTALFPVVQYGAYDLALPASDVLEVVAEKYNPRCDPPMDADELARAVFHKANDAKTKSQRPRAEPPPRALEAIFSGAAPAAAASAPPSPSAPPGGRSIVVVSGGELATPVPPTSYVWRHFGISPGRPTLLAGYGGVGKTFVAQWLALAVSADLGEVWDLPIVGGSVLWLDYEMTFEPTKRRLQRMANAMEVDLRAAKFGVASMPDVYLSDADAEDALCRATEGRVLAFVDNLAAATATSLDKENESGIRKYLDRLTRVTQRTGCAFVVLAHERKGNAKEEGPAIQRVRGSSAITDACGAVISASSEGGETITLHQSKASVRRKGEDIVVQLEDIGSPPGPDEDSPGLLVTRLEEAPTDESLALAEARVLEVLRSKGAQATKANVEALVGGKKDGSAGRAIDALVVKRQVVKLPGVGFAVDSEAARLDRIRRAAVVVGNSTAEKVAKAAHVGVDEVQKLIAESVLYPSGRAFAWQG